MDKLKHELKIAGGNLANRWERSLERFRWYLAAVGEDGSEDKKKVAILLTVAGAEAQEVFRTFTYEPAKAAVGNQPAVQAETAEQFNTVVRKFTEFCVPRKNVIYERYVFHTRVQGEDNDSTGDEGGFFVSAIHNNTQQCEWIALLTVYDSLVPLKVDSGAQVNILSLSDYEGIAKVLVKAERPTDWVLPLVIVEKPNGDLRLCLDPMDLNEYIRREHYHLPHRSEILSEMADARYFTKMDASQGFYQIQLDEESTQLCTVATPFGRYSFKRLPYGINCAPEIFHAKIQQLFESETGVKVFMDGIVVWGRTREEHDARLKMALATIRRSGLKLNEKKCVFGVTELTYLGEKLTHQGIKPDPDKVAGICNMPVPTIKEEVQRALGMVNYMAKFVPNLTVKTTALRQLLLEKNDWLWEAEQT
ncbi:hypothetical protein NP493_331g04021 [Ridgeia piscesae]|uniref:Reverse transcriptase domain-containing protein n=1 Tax=Ridgeia piscesae TaxID=27915 RepID=A0AAD9NVR3_RIDPI|nr:hypothetical protein NP493_331g04021 [Ridgeia piscesae]